MQQSTSNNAASSGRDKNLIKGLIVGALILLMLVPAHYVSIMVAERQQRRQEVVREVSSKWADHQTIKGPVLMLPYRCMVKGADEKLKETVRAAYILPTDLHISGSVQPMVKRRSLYSVILYGSKLKLEGRFDALPLDKLEIPRDQVIWSGAKLALQVDDTRGISEEINVNWAGTPKNMEAGLPDYSVMNEGLSASVDAEKDGPFNFSITLGLKGSESLYFTPAGKTTDVTLSGDWGSPAFDGQYLPETSNITKDNFSARWKVLSHNHPQYWKGDDYKLENGSFGVRLIQPVDGYAKTDRSLKYCLLIIALTFTFFFFLEVLFKSRMHPIQYLLVGMALIVFYTLLLSISETTGFNTAYLIASLAIITLISSYSWSILKNPKTVLGFTAVISLLYTYIFILIQLEDYALLAGSIGLFVILAVIMYYSRKIDWYGAAKIPSTPDQPDPNTKGYNFMVYEQPEQE